MCGKDFRGEGDDCSPECEAQHLESIKETCEACGDKIEFNQELEHHVSYDPEKTVFVHAGCHQIIHKTDRYPHLKPSQEEVDQYHARIRKSNETRAEKENGVST